MNYLKIAEYSKTKIGIPQLYTWISTHCKYWKIQILLTLKHGSSIYLTTVRTFIRSCWNAKTSNPEALSANFRKFSAKGPRRACNCLHDLAYCLRTSSIMVDVNANPTRTYKVHSNIYLGCSGSKRIHSIIIWNVKDRSNLDNINTNEILNDKNDQLNLGFDHTSRCWKKVMLYLFFGVS